MPDSPRGRGERALKVRVKNARGRKASSVRWLERQLNDPYVSRARAEHRRARSAYKLMEIDDRFHLLGAGRRVIDLGAAPGGWSELTAERTGSTAARPLVVAVDTLPMDPIPGVVILQRDFLDEDAPDAIREAVGGVSVDVILSDMAAPTTGHRQTDHLRTMQLCEAAAAFAVGVLKPGGAFVCKVFSGGTESALLAELKRAFTTVHHVKPPASRAASPEIYLVARGFRGPLSRARASR